MNLIHDMYSKITLYKLSSHLSGANEFSSVFSLNPTIESEAPTAWWWRPAKDLASPGISILAENCSVHYLKHVSMSMWVRSWNSSCLVTWFCYQLIAKPGTRHLQLHDLTHIHVTTKRSPYVGWIMIHIFCTEMAPAYIIITYHNFFLLHQLLGLIDVYV